MTCRYADGIKCTPDSVLFFYLPKSTHGYIYDASFCLDSAAPFPPASTCRCKLWCPTRVTPLRIKAPPLASARLPWGSISLLTPTWCSPADSCCEDDTNHIRTDGRLFRYDWTAK